MISQFPKISAVYYGMLQTGYSFYTFERSAEHIKEIQAHCKTEQSFVFFSKARESTCEVYPYWPRAFIMEAATFSLNNSTTAFQDFDRFRQKIMSAGNITEKERDDSLWNWLADFPQALNSVLAEDSFSEYLKWEKKWISEQNDIYREELYLIQKCLEICTDLYRSPVRTIRICINPIKCVYSSDYHLIGDCFIFSSGEFRTDSIIHEFLHHVVHPYIEQQKALAATYGHVNSEIDKSYYLSENDAGLINAFEETVVRSLTKEILKGKYPESLSDYIGFFLTQKQSGE